MEDLVEVAMMSWSTLASCSLEAALQGLDERKVVTAGRAPA